MPSLIDRIDHVGSRWWFTDAVFLSICGAIVAAAVMLTPSTEAVSFFGVEVPILCSWRQLTGIPCPGCGLTRSFTFMAHGRFAEAFQLNMLGPPTFLFVAAQVPWRIVRLVRGSRPRAAQRS
jgi:hypothetical protein